VRTLVLLLALVLAGCISTPVTKIVEVKVPVIKPCIDKVPLRPAYQFGAGDWPGEKPASLLLTADLEAAKQYGAAWEAAAAGCIIKPPANP